MSNFHKLNTLHVYIIYIKSTTQGIPVTIYCKNMLITCSTIDYINSISLNVKISPHFNLLLLLLSLCGYIYSNALKYFSVNY